MYLSISWYTFAVVSKKFHFLISYIFNLHCFKVHIHLWSVQCFTRERTDAQQQEKPFLLAKGLVQFENIQHVHEWLRIYCRGTTNK